MKNKNPLYVVKGKDVMEANSMMDLLVKKLNLEPAIMILKNILNLLLEQVQNFAMYKAVMTYINEMMEKMRSMGVKMGLLQV